ncbi:MULTISPECIES: DegT/DnrJ/EryC1/StrS family aminotransferase [Clostridium]|uniref:DegT/DnrJ/EryC1/StrS family aminotransferase n=1 Tax=Clostridium TaxID=1485 RepID=UPI000824E16B|nr:MULTISPECIES: DegT/DnrJ/EryC1/StrS family aminotransferase [Clostridium]PJI09694.1 DegT/DnrJ/EryC1/StrS family aminotransferase [Clostridium sp. CT7]
MINVTKTYLPPFDKYVKYIKKIFDTGIITNNGEMVRKLEKNIEQYLDVKNVVLVQSGTLALQLAYKILNLKGSVLTTPFSFVATISSQVWEGLNPIFVDINKDTLNIDTKLIEKNITDDVSAIVPVHVFGNSCDVEKIDEVSSKHNIKVVYDAAHAFGVKYKGKSILNYGDISAISFHATKVFHTIEGGALIIKDDKLYEKALLMRNFGINGIDSVKNIGINAKMNEFEAAMGLCILDDMDKILENRKNVYERYMSYIKGDITFQIHNNNSTLNYSYFPIILKDEGILKRVQNLLLKEGISPRRYFYPCLSKLSYLKSEEKMPIAEDISKRILCLPFYDSLEADVQWKIIKIVNNVLA